MSSFISFHTIKLQAILIMKGCFLSNCLLFILGILGGKICSLKAQTPPVVDSSIEERTYFLRYAKPTKMLVCFCWAHSTLDSPFKLLLIFDSNCPPSLTLTENWLALIMRAVLFIYLLILRIMSWFNKRIMQCIEIIRIIGTNEFYVKHSIA